MGSAGTSARRAVEHVAEGRSGGALPFAETIQRSFGRHDIAGVRSYQDDRAKVAADAIGASAFASGDSVAFGEAPSLHTAAHEAAHVIQQQKGVSLPGGMDTPGDAYEVHADAVADAVVAGESAEHLLDHAPTGSGHVSSVQRQPKGHPANAGAHGGTLPSPGPALTVTLIGPDRKVIATTSVALMHADRSIGEAQGIVKKDKAIEWDGAPVGVQIGSGTYRKGTKGKAGSKGESLEDWAQRHGAKEGTRVVVRIEESVGVADDARDTGTAQTSERTKLHQESAAKPREGGTGTDAKRDGRADQKLVPNAPSGAESREGDSTESHWFEHPGSAHGGPSGGKDGKPSGHRDGTAGQKGHAQHDVGFFAPKGDGAGNATIDKDEASSAGRAGGEGKHAQQGMSSALGIVPLISLPAVAATAIDLGVILADADIAGVSDQLGKKATALLKKGLKAKAIEKELAKDIATFTEGQFQKLERHLASDAEFGAKSAAERAAILREAREGLETEARQRITARLDQQIMEAEQNIARAEASRGTLRDDVLNDEIRESTQALDEAQSARSILGSQSEAKAAGVAGKEPPTRYSNQFPEHEIAPPRQEFALANLKTKTGEFNYVVTADGKLKVGKIAQEPGGGHIDLAGGGDVIAAGEVKLINGKVKYIDNSSGHYLPAGRSPREAAERAFSEAGFDVEGKYVEKMWDEGKGKWTPVK